MIDTDAIKARLAAATKSPWASTVAALLAAFENERQARIDAEADYTALRQDEAAQLARVAALEAALEAMSSTVKEAVSAFAAAHAEVVALEAEVEKLNRYRMKPG